MNQLPLAPVPVRLMPPRPPKLKTHWLIWPGAKKENDRIACSMPAQCFSENTDEVTCKLCSEFIAHPDQLWTKAYRRRKEVVAAALLELATRHQGEFADLVSDGWNQIEAISEEERVLRALRGERPSWKRHAGQFMNANLELPTTILDPKSLASTSRAAGTTVT